MELIHFLVMHLTCIKRNLPEMERISFPCGFIVGRLHCVLHQFVVLEVLLSSLWLRWYVQSCIVSLSTFCLFYLTASKKSATDYLISILSKYKQLLVLFPAFCFFLPAYCFCLLAYFPHRQQSSAFCLSILLSWGATPMQIQRVFIIFASNSQS